MSRVRGDGTTSLRAARHARVSTCRTVTHVNQRRRQQTADEERQTHGSATRRTTTEDYKEESRQVAITGV